MVPSLDPGMSLFCAEEAAGGIWESEGDSQCNEDDQLSPISSIEEDEAIAVLIEKEVCHMPENDYAERYQMRELDAGSRKHAVDWILKVQTHYNLSPVTSYLSVNYFDRFLSSHRRMQWKDWMLQLLAASCICLAAKVEEADVFHPLDLQVGDMKYIFEAKTIHRMELLILGTLRWRISSVTPFSYTGYLLQRAALMGPPSGGLTSRITELILSTCRSIRFVCMRPSAIATASVIRAWEEAAPAGVMRSRGAMVCGLRLAMEEASIRKCYEAIEHTLQGDPLCTSWPPSHSPDRVLEAAACLSSQSESGG